MRNAPEEIDTKQLDDLILCIGPLYFCSGSDDCNSLQSHSIHSSFLSIFRGVAHMEHYRAVSGPFGYSDYKSILA